MISCSVWLCRSDGFFLLCLVLGMGLRGFRRDMLACLRNLAKMNKIVAPRESRGTLPEHGSRTGSFTPQLAGTAAVLQR